jgi:arsenite methyltransferase
MRARRDWRTGGQEQEEKGLVMQEHKGVVVDQAERLVQVVRESYGRIAAEGGSCCQPASSCCGPSEARTALELGYRPEDLQALPDGANLGLGCGAPVALLDLRAGETVLDLGSGAGVDVFLAARAVGATGRAIGVDMTPEMLARARANAQRAGLVQVEFREGRLEALPVEDASVDAVTSNCVVNLVPDKAAVFREIARVLKRGGRLVIADIVLDTPLPEAVAADVYAYAGCISGASLRADYFAMVERAGLGRIEILAERDPLAGYLSAAPEEAWALAARTGVRVEDLLGTVRSVTYRAWKA